MIKYINIFALVAKFRHGLVTMLVVAIILLITFMDVVSSLFEISAQDAVRLIQPHPEPRDEDADGCLVMDDGIKICDDKLSSVSQSVIPLRARLDLDAGGTGFDRICSLSPAPSFSGVHNLRQPQKEALNALSWMTRRIGISANFKMLTGDFLDSSTAFAAIRQNQRFIVYDSAKLFKGGKGELSFVDTGVIAHELGHHISGHTAARNQPNHTRELEADLFAGFILGSLGADAHQAVSWTNILSAQGSITHPARAKRKRAALDGWVLAQNTRIEMGGQCSTQWLGDSLSLDGNTCRVTRYCENGEPRIRVACEHSEGQWRWIE